MKILVRTALNPRTGYGRDGLGLLRALLRAGLDVRVDAGYVAPPLPADVAALLTRPLEPPFDLFIHHADPAALDLPDHARAQCATTVAWTMWEYTTFDNLKGRTGLRKRLRNYDLLLGYDSVSAGAFSPAYLPKNTALDILQGGYWPDEWPAARRDWHTGPFRFAMVGALHQRKDPFLAINAFRELREEHPDLDMELHLKTVTPGLHPKIEEWVDGIKVHYEVWSDEQMRRFYADMHVLLAPSRGEGKNMPALEFLSTGGTVIATNWGGHTQWLSSQYAYPLDYTLAPQDPRLPNCLSARASKEHLKQLMLHAYHNRADCARKGDIAATVIPRMCGWDTVVERLFQKLADNTRHGGALLDAMRRSRAAVNEQRRPVHV